MHPKRCARIRASKDHGCDYMKGMGKREAGERSVVNEERGKGVVAK